MKRILGITTILMLSLGVISCEKFLAVDPPYAQDAENYFLTEEDYDNALTGAYDLLQSSFLSVWYSVNMYEYAFKNTVRPVVVSATARNIIISSTKSSIAFF